ncbi:MAG TPA: hypothetical protein ENN61_05675, partial [Bacteroidaceae bacterium]|nr:hypothetical protein [Bacteroidaceae bacterium]
MADKRNIKELLEEKILVLDGAIGTMIQRYKLSEKDFRDERLKNHPVDLSGNNDILCLTQPEIIKDIHEAYLVAGADIIETNTFNATSISQADYGTESLVFEINFEAARIAAMAAERYTNQTPSKPRYVAGSIGPTNKTASMSPDVNDPGYRAVSFDDLKISYKEQVRG